MIPPYVQNLIADQYEKEGNLTKAIQTRQDISDIAAMKASNPRIKPYIPLPSHQNTYQSSYQTSAFRWVAIASLVAITSTVLYYKLDSHE